jgi:hypothetical protein
MNLAASTREKLAAYFRAKAGVRSYVAEERCGEGSSGQLKNELYAERLEQVAGYVEQLPDDDPYLSAAADLNMGVFDRLHTHTIHSQFPKGGLLDWLESWLFRSAPQPIVNNQLPDSSLPTVIVNIPKDAGKTPDTR